ncbi:hypothetical protein PP635_gp41 [Arthrobacter phage Auxilium]|uniref:Uncharacterized protein n=2 Tax=Caudoviricetes TaxID=2731619 RepID=A0A3G3M3L1_9CAUD|nr:hypothetical protein PP635_gp41 [Arthrobacter phage Auxilium]YP_010656133.1 hypothetical protein PP638_gp59 [Arthrobacter phage Isolde]UVF61007.1 hypothetical protein SEA_GORPY_45 [Arthrobacter phage Gorpy]UVK61991.1 hypothetical protein SEA_SAKAI_44 [Arthrobacter phage Sakai]AYN55820.1 hypothetical protein PBI_AUXILIUM_41 [Arthrobacter phage Auxilium]AYR01013.1 hypothetical protein PBI_ISOLDE_44 [Arthrobacter phage Isolde]
MSEQGAFFDGVREAYEAAQKKLLDLIDGPDKGLHFSEYRKQLNAALQEQQEAHDAMMAAWDAPRIVLGLPDNEQDWKAIAAAHVPIMVHTCDSEAYAAAWNDGYEAAVTQGLADDPTLADDWFQGKLREARAGVLDDAATAIEISPHNSRAKMARHFRNAHAAQLRDMAADERGQE